MTTGATDTAQAGLSLGHSASGPPKKAVKGAAGRPCRYEPTDVKTRRLGTRGDRDLETDGSADRRTARRAADRSPARLAGPDKPLKSDEVAAGAGRDAMYQATRGRRAGDSDHGDSDASGGRRA